MVEGLDRFRTHFANFTDHYVLIGGTVCSTAMENAVIELRRIYQIV